jgi:CubicO group peptidase (beta-lactamase class C family)
MNRIVLILLFLVGMYNADGQMQQAVDNIQKEYNLMGLSVAAVCDGRLAGTWHAGLRDYERNLPVNDSTMYRIASISKFVLTTAMMKLREEKLLSLDEDVSNYLGFTLRNPHHPDKPLTVSMLLLHTSSINEGSGYDTFLTDTYNNVSDPPSFTELLVPGGRYYTDDMWKEEAPGTYYTYCNANFGLAGTVIEKITGQRFEDYMKETLFKPLGITGSYIPEGVRNINNLAVIYRAEEGKWIPQTDDYRGVMSSPRDFSGYITGTNAAVFSPQGGLRISAAELARIMILHLKKGKYEGKRVISARSIKLMHTPRWDNDGTNGDVEGSGKDSRAPGVQILPQAGPGEILPEGVTMMGHSGAAYGLISLFYFNPEGRYGFIFMTNGVFNGPQKKNSSPFYSCEDAIVKALRENHYLPCGKIPKKN